MRAFLSLFLAAFPLAAQFSNLATDDTGSRVWFSSSLRLRGTQQNLIPKIFMADALGNVQLVAQVTSGDPYSILTTPEVSMMPRITRLSLISFYASIAKATQPQSRSRRKSCHHIPLSYFRAAPGL